MAQSKSLEGTKTQANLMAAFAGESQARNKYTYYANKARQEGYQQIGDIFDMTAANEQAHAEIWFKLLKEGQIPNTQENLKDAAGGEHYEWVEMYAQFAQEAHEEGFERIAFLFEAVGKIEKEHEERYNKLLAAITNEEVFKKGPQTVWICRNCGHVHVGPTPPGICSVCSYKQDYFEMKAENY